MKKADESGRGTIFVFLCRCRLWGRPSGPCPHFCCHLATSLSRSQLRHRGGHESWRAAWLAQRRQDVHHTHPHRRSRHIHAARPRWMCHTGDPCVDYTGTRSGVPPLVAESWRQLRQSGPCIALFVEVVPRYRCGPEHGIYRAA